MYNLAPRPYFDSMGPSDILSCVKFLFNAYYTFLM